MNDMYNDDAYEAIESAIKSASGGICPQVDLDPKMFDPLTQGSFNSWYPLFDSAISAERHRISEDQDEIDQITYSATCGWLYGYYCGEQEALSTISAEDDKKSNQYDENKKSSSEQSNDQENSTGRTEETANSESSPDNDFVESEELESSDEEEILRKLEQAKHWCFGLAAALAVAIIVIVIIIINSRMMS